MSNKLCGKKIEIITTESTNRLESRNVDWVATRDLINFISDSKIELDQKKKNPANQNQNQKKTATTKTL